MDKWSMAKSMVMMKKKQPEKRPWANPLKEKIKNLGRPSYCEGWTIYKVPRNIRKGDHAAYNPRIVSIGPYHRGKQRLQDMEEHKRRLRDDLFKRNQITNLSECSKQIQELEEDARRCYSVNIDLESEEFIEMMVLDACFIIEFFLKLEEGKVPMNGMIWSLPLIAFDLILLENQIPFSILTRLFELIKPEKTIPELTNSEYSISIHPLLKLATKFLHKCVLSSDKEDLPMAANLKPYHLLHLLHLICRPNHDSPDPVDHSINIPTNSNEPQLDHKPPKRERLGSIPSATELQEAGVKFRKMENPSSLLDINFSKGVLEIPHQIIDASTNSLLRNLIAFEQCDSRCESYFSSYARFMDLIINTSEDVALLHRNNIIEHELGSDEEVAYLFNNLSKGVYNYFFDDTYHFSLFKKVRAHCNTRWNRNCATLKHDYFRNPWASISMVAAGILLIFALTQTIFTCLSYLHPLS